MNAAFYLSLAGITVMIGGIAAVGAAAWRSHKTSARLDFIRSLGNEAELYAEPIQVPERVTTSLMTRTCPGCQPTSIRQVCSTMAGA